MSGFNFGSGALGATNNTGGGFSFGAATSAPAASTSGFSFGTVLGTAAATPASTTTTASLGLGGNPFGQKPTGGFSFNTPTSSAAAPATGLTLGGAPASTAATTGFSLAFSKPTASASPFSLTTSTASSTVGTGLSFGSILTSTAPQQPAATTFSLGLGGSTASTAASTVPSLGGSLFSSSVSTGLGQTTLGAGGGLTLGSLLGTSTAASTAPAPSIGLGGVDFSTSSENKSDTLSGSSEQDSKVLKDENLPPVICQDVENFQKFVKEQKQVQEEISRMSSKAISKVQDDIKNLKQLLSVNASGLQRQALAIDKLKQETAQELKNADIALRTQKTPPGLQHENTAPSDYFRSLVEQFEVQLQQYRQQIEELENHLTTQSSGSHITPQDLTMAMQKLYQTFVAQAAQLQSVHENVKILKQQYLSYRRAFLEDTTDIFETKRASNRKWQSASRVTTGPAPFSTVPNAAAVAMAATLTQQQQPTPGTQAPLGAGFGNPFASAVGTSLGSSTLGGFAGGPGFGGVGCAGSSFGFSTAAKPAGGSLSAGMFSLRKCCPPTCLSAYEEEDEDSEEDSDEFEEVDFEDLDDCRTIASDDSFYPPDDAFADSERSPSPESPELLSLFRACCTNNAAIVRIMIRHGVTKEEVKETDGNNRTGLLIACYHGFVDVVIALSQCPYLDVNWQDSEGNTALITAAQAGHITITNYLLNYYSGLDIERRNCHGFTPLMKAAMQGRMECVRALMLAGASLDARDHGRNLTAREWALFTGRYETAWMMIRLMERPCPYQFCDTYSLEWPPLASLAVKAQEPRGCLKRLSDTVRNIFNIANVTNPEDEGVIDHMVSVTTAIRSPFIAVACHTVCPDSPPSVGKRRYAVPEILRQQRAKELRSTNPERVDSHLKHFQNSRVTLVAKSAEDRRASLQVQRLVPRHRSSSVGRVVYNQALELRRTSLLPMHMVLRRSSVRPGFSIPKVRVSKAPTLMTEPVNIRRKSSAREGGVDLLQIPKWRYKELKEERRKAEEAERRRLESVTRRHIAAGNRK